MRPKKFAPLKKFLRRKKSMRFAGTIGAVALGTMGGCVAAVAILVAARQPSPPANLQAANLRTLKTQSQQKAAEPMTKQGAAQFGTTSAPSNASADEAIAVSITGCLQRDVETFRLDTTTGADAPKSRNWKSAFLKRRPVSIEIVDAAHRLELPNQVGQRVSVTGVLVDREMRARSLQRVAGSCDS
jgi:hypothetical protein